jgi:hypothetical protein
MAHAAGASDKWTQSDGLGVVCYILTFSLVGCMAWALWRRCQERQQRGESPCGVVCHGYQVTLVHCAPALQERAGSCSCCTAVLGRRGILAGGNACMPPGCLLATTDCCQARVSLHGDRLLAKPSMGLTADYVSTLRALRWLLGLWRSCVTLLLCAAVAVWHCQRRAAVMVIGCTVYRVVWGDAGPTCSRLRRRQVRIIYQDGTAHCVIHAFHCEAKPWLSSSCLN